jgi:hypothetical protein
MAPTPQQPSAPCSGWWEQRWFGRRPMEQLRLAVSPPRIEGSGTDCIGPFVLDGVFTAGGGVSIQKTYVGQHGVTYDGHYDGEGRMWGMWKCGPDMGRWMIAMLHEQNAAELSEDVEEIRAGRKEGDTAS